MSWRKKKKKLKYCTHPKSSKGWLINHEPSLLPLITTSTKNRRRLFILNTVLEIEGLPTDIWLKRQIELWRRGFVGGLILRLKTTSEEMWFFHIMPRTCYTPLFLETLMIILGTESRNCIISKIQNRHRSTKDCAEHHAPFVSFQTGSLAIEVERVLSLSSNKTGSRLIVEDKLPGGGKYEVVKSCISLPPYCAWTHIRRKWDNTYRKALGTKSSKISMRMFTRQKIQDGVHILQFTRSLSFSGKCCCSASRGAISGEK